MTGMKHYIAVAVVVAMATMVHAGQDKETPPFRLAVDLSDGSRLIGAPAVTSVPIDTAFGRISLPMASAKTITFSEGKDDVVVALANGDQLTGRHALTDLPLSTLVGNVRLRAAVIRRIAFMGTRAGVFREGLVLWNRLGSEAELKDSDVGPGGTKIAGRFVEGRFGQGVELSVREEFGVSFPAEVLADNQGCIEFWAKLVDFPLELPAGARPFLFAVTDDRKGFHVVLHFNGNDGASKGGLCAGAVGLSGTGTGQYGDWTYERALGGGNVSEWHHYAVVWSSDGIKGVDNGTRQVAVFVDGKLNSGAWDNPTGGRMNVPKNARIGLMSPHSSSSGKVVYDNIKIWKGAKTDFSDRDEE